jgi:hypothetical protein
MVVVQIFVCLCVCVSAFCVVHFIFFLSLLFEIWFFFYVE